MKMLKYSFLLLLVAVIIDVSLVYAYTPSINEGVYVGGTIPTGNQFYTPYYTKTTYTTMYYQNDLTFTWLTNPCPKCKISTKPFGKDGTIGMAIITQMGDKESWKDSPADYRLMVYREDVTALKTTTQGYWTVNTN